MALEDTVTLLARTAVVGQLDRAALRLLAHSAENRRLRRGEALFREGDRADGGFVVLQGLIEVGRDGSEAPVEAGPGALIGRAALFVEGTRPATAIAREPARVLRIAPALMRRVLVEHPAAAAAMRDQLAADLTELMTSLGRVRSALDAIGRPSSSGSGGAGSRVRPES